MNTHTKNNHIENNNILDYCSVANFSILYSKIQIKLFLLHS